MSREITELDHVFLFVKDESTARVMMAAAGLRVNYSRVHPGQGTRNLCACLDDVFLELLWLDGSEIANPSKEITLAARGRGEGMPIGVSWRGSSPWEESPDGTVPYAAPFLPAGQSIPVARASLDPALPFVFRTPGGVPPIERSDTLVGTRQAPELATLGSCEIVTPDVDITAELLAPFERITVKRGSPALRCHLLRPDGTHGKTVNWAARL